MSRISRLLALVLVLGWLAPAARAAESGNDIDPDKQEEGTNFDPKFWDTNGKEITFPLMDADKKYKLFKTKVYLASTNLYASHCKDSSGGDKAKRKHLHFQHDYGNSEADADRFWNKKFDAPTTTTKLANSATTRHNCYSYSLKNFINREGSTYNYWMELDQARIAMFADCEPKPKEKVETNDVLFYFIIEDRRMKDHMTGVKLAEECKIKKLRWKTIVSPVYDYDTGKFDTPMYVGPNPNKEGANVDDWAKDNWTWDAGGAGKEANLTPKDKVLRKKPKN
jgi:hypothetical protein